MELDGAVIKSFRKQAQAWRRVMCPEAAAQTAIGVRCGISRRTRARSKPPAIRHHGSFLKIGMSRTIPPPPEHHHHPAGQAGEREEGASGYGR